MCRNFWRMADPTALTVATAAAHAVEYVGLPEAQLNLAQAVIHQATAPTRGTWSVRRGTEVPQYVAFPPPDQGRSLGRPLLTIR